MAIMIPQTPREFAPASLEDQIFDALAQLSDEYTVVHSLHVMNVNRGVLYECEADFVILHRQKGVLVIEAKASSAGIEYHNGKWYYGSGVEMSHDGPYIQATKAAHKILKLCEDLGMADVLRRCKCLSAVWFPTIDRETFRKINLPPEADPRLTLTMEALSEPQKYIDDIMDISVGQMKKSSMTSRDVELLLKNIICPEFRLTPSVCMDLEKKRFIFNRLLKEQSRLLDYLQDQPCGVISGAAGTGKTMLAIEMARRNALRGERVLFLCYNSMLKEHLAQHHAEKLVDYYTIDGFACSLTHTAVTDFQKAQALLEEMYIEGSFPYQHVIIDEGQDFGKEHIEESDILELLQNLVLDKNDQSGTFYVFYDKNQKIQARELPKVIENADCKLTLYQNCRNTRSIADTSVKVLPPQKRLRLADHCLTGVVPSIVFAQSKEEQFDVLNRCIESCWEKNYQDVVILTMATEITSVYASELQNGFYRYNRKQIPFTTCRKFKGLEADAIILVDIKGDIWSGDSSQMFYVGTSRARFHLEAICAMGEQECRELITKHQLPATSRNPKRTVAMALKMFCS